MDTEIKIKNPGDVSAKVSEVSVCFETYTTIVRESVQQLLKMSSIVSETKEAIILRKRGLYTAIEQAKRMDDSEIKERHLRGLQLKLQKNEDQERLVNNNDDEFMKIIQDMENLVQESASISENGRVLFLKIQRLIDQLIEVM